MNQSASGGRRFSTAFPKKRYTAVHVPLSSTIAEESQPPIQYEAPKFSVGIKKPSEFSIDESIEILQKIRAGDFEVDMGLEQFRKKEELPSYKKNLGSVFSKLDDRTHRSVASRESMAFATSTIEERASSSVLSRSKSRRTLGGAASSFQPKSDKYQLDKGLDLGDFMQIEENYSELPEFFKKIDTFIVGFVVYHKISLQLAKVLAHRAIAQAFPKEKWQQLLQKTKKVTKTLKIFLEQSDQEKARRLLPHDDLFSSQESTKKSQKTLIPCELSMQKDAVRAMKRLMELLQNLETLVPELVDKDAVPSLDRLEDAIDQVDDELKRSNLILRSERLAEKEKGKLGISDESSNSSGLDWSISSESEGTQ